MFDHGVNDFSSGWSPSTVEKVPAQNPGKAFGEPLKIRGILKLLTSAVHAPIPDWTGQATKIFAPGPSRTQ